MNNRWVPPLCFISLILLSGCASASTKASLDRINNLVKDQTGVSDLDRLSEADTQREIQSILDEPLTVDSAVRIDWISL